MVYKYLQSDDSRWMQRLFHHTRSGTCLQLVVLGDNSKKHFIKIFNKYRFSSTAFRRAVNTDTAIRVTKKKKSVNSPDQRQDPGITLNTVFIHSRVPTFVVLCSPSVWFIFIYCTESFWSLYYRYAREYDRNKSYFTRAGGTPAGGMVATAAGFYCCAY